MQEPLLQFVVIDPLFGQGSLELFLGFLSGRFVKGELLFEGSRHKDLECQNDQDGRDRSDDIGISPSVQSDG